MTMDTAIPHMHGDELMEFSVVFTDRALNHMSPRFQQVMRDIHAMLCEVYRASSAVIVPGGGTYGMEAVARQFATGRKVMVVRNGWFSYRWSQIFEAGQIPAETVVVKARPAGNTHPAPFAPPPLEDVTRMIAEERPEVVFAPHVETSAGIILPDDYLTAIAAAAHDAGALFVLDCIASGAAWIDMEKTGVDVLISAPQKGWSASPSAGLVMLSERALGVLAERKSTSFAADLGKWHQIMQAYVNGGHAYHATMPTDALAGFRDAMAETRAHGFDRLKAAQFALGRGIRDLMAAHGYRSVAAPGFEAPGVAVFYADDPEMQTGKPFLAQGMQIAAGVPLMCDEPADFRTFRIGLFGLDKLYDVEGTVARFEDTLKRVEAARAN